MSYSEFPYLQLTSYEPEGSDRKSFSDPKLQRLLPTDICYISDSLGDWYHQARVKLFLLLGD